ncbi:nicotinate-nucleotide--dimethylbenzimidazole phosphoribosyltransferase [Leeia oryzae]|uniref:nicotinate-nucleotide--dimethylbenzimidazole phosphoribosyltransferase n=1 Tax=Leeia oryzae TaxID=356662 RepID=UPI000360361F|nr:nicotinate-nucleotide--dimethylbenzimidazole phosphoribosyltransferase [Leeia oryzae]
MNWWTEPVKPVSEDARQQALHRQSQLTKPAGALGELENLAVTLAGMQGVEQPHIVAPWITVFAADHGIALEGVSAFPRAVTAQMVANFVQGGAAICVLAKALSARFEVVDVGVEADTRHLASVVQAKISPGTANCRHVPAMTMVQLHQAFYVGASAVERALSSYADVFIAGEMGIGNTTVASALAARWLQMPAEAVAGPGTGLAPAGVVHKVRVLNDILATHAGLTDTEDELAAMGGYEVAAICGAYIRAAQAGLPCLVDGFISSVSALAACRINPGVRDWLIFGHQSAEPAHQWVLEAMQARPLLQLGMRLGEASGAAAAVPILKLACELHAQMATFAEASVSQKEE